MRAEELRIGNWVYLPSKGKDYQIDSGHDIDEIESSGDAIPIPLTEEWLLRFGFYRQNNAWNAAEPYDTFRIWNLPGTEVFSFNDFVFVPEINYVHQLQNLFFAITLREL